MKRYILCSLTVLALMVTPTFAQDASMPGEGTTVTPAIGNWESARPPAQIFKHFWKTSVMRLRTRLPSPIQFSTNP